MARKKPDTLRIGSGAGFAGDRLEPAVILAERGKSLSYALLEMAPAPSGINGTGGLERELLGSCAASLTELAITSDRLESKVVNLQAYVANVCLQTTK